jgi:hypothetical protein
LIGLIGFLEFLEFAAFVELLEFVEFIALAEMLSKGFGGEVPTASVVAAISLEPCCSG